MPKLCPKFSYCASHYGQMRLETRKHSFGSEDSSFWRHLHQIVCEISECQVSKSRQMPAICRSAKMDPKYNLQELSSCNEMWYPLHLTWTEFYFNISDSVKENRYRWIHRLKIHLHHAINVCNDFNIEPWLDIWARSNARVLDNDILRQFIMWKR